MNLYRSTVLVCGGTGCTSSGSHNILERFETLIRENGLENEIMVRAKCNADTRIPFQNGNTPSFLCRMQVYNTITIAKVHRQYIGSPIRIGQSHITDITLLNGRFNQFFVGMY